MQICEQKKVPAKTCFEKQAYVTNGNVLGQVT